MYTNLRMAAIDVYAMAETESQRANLINYIAGQIDCTPATLLSAHQDLHYNIEVTTDADEYPPGYPTSAKGR